MSIINEIKNMVKDIKDLVNKSLFRTIPEFLFKNLPIFAFRLFILSSCLIITLKFYKTMLFIHLEEPSYLYRVVIYLFIAAFLLLNKNQIMKMPDRFLSFLSSSNKKNYLFVYLCIFFLIMLLLENALSYLFLFLLALFVSLNLLKTCASFYEIFIDNIKSEALPDINKNNNENIFYIFFLFILTLSYGIVSDKYESIALLSILFYILIFFYLHNLFLDKKILSIKSHDINEDIHKLKISIANSVIRLLFSLLTLSVLLVVYNNDISSEVSNLDILSLLSLYTDSFFFIVLFFLDIFIDITTFNYILEERKIKTLISFLIILISFFVYEVRMKQHILKKFQTTQSGVVEKEKINVNDIDDI